MTNINTHEEMRNRFIGSIMGLAIGDAVGAPFEGLTASHIYQIGPPRKLIETPCEFFWDRDKADSVLRYTDDTQMMLGVVDTLLQHGQIDTETLLQCFLNRYEKKRGYGRSLRTLFHEVQRGVDLRQAALTVFPEGSFGNGAAMRVAPIGLFFAHDLDRIEVEAAKSAQVTHFHPWGIEGAKLLALAIGLAFRTPRQNFDRDEFLTELLNRTETEEFQWQLETLRDIDRDVLLSFGSEPLAHRSVVSAIQIFVDYPDSYSTVIQHAIGLGDDTDTLAAMSGALSGAFLGETAIPPHLLCQLEDDHDAGRTFIRRQAELLFEKAFPASL